MHPLIYERVKSAMQSSQGLIAKVPSASTLCRTRLSFDVSFMLAMRQVFGGMLKEGVLIAIMADSSPQAGHDWLLAEMVTLEYKNVQRFMSCFFKLAELDSTAANEQGSDEQDEGRIHTYTHNTPIHIAHVCQGFENIAALTILTNNQHASMLLASIV